MDVKELIKELMSSAENGHDYVETLTDYDIDVKSKTIYFHCDVEEITAATLIKQINYVDKVLCKSENDFITLSICSYGGTVDHMLAIYDAIQNTKHRVVTVGTGSICSAAFLILACGKERHATENSWAMIHKISGGAIGDEEEVEAQSSFMKKQQQQYYTLLARHTSLSAPEWRELVNKKRESWFTPSEMLKHGLVDSIIKPNTVRKPAKKKTAPRKKK